MTEKRDSTMFMLKTVPVSVEAPPGWGVELVSPHHEEPRSDFRTKFSVDELFLLFTEFCDKIYTVRPKPNISRAHVVRYLEAHCSEHVRFTLQVTDDLLVVQDYPKLSDMCEILFSGVRENPVLIGGVEILYGLADRRDVATEWYLWYDDDIHSRSPVLKTPSGALIFILSYFDVVCAGISNDGKHVWWFCGKTFFIVSSDGNQLIYAWEHEGGSTFSKCTGIGTEDENPTAIYRARDGSLWFELGDTHQVGLLEHNSNLGGIIKYMPWGREQYLKLALRLTDSLPGNIPRIVPERPDFMASQVYLAIKDGLLAQIRCGELVDGGLFLITAIRHKDEEMIRWLFREIKNRRYKVDLALFDSVPFGPEYDVLKRRIRESVVNGHYYRNLLHAQ